MNCPYCGEELEYNDYFGSIKYADHYYLYPQSWIEKKGEIFKCINENCSDYDSYFYVYLNSDIIHKGYPC